MKNREELISYCLTFKDTYPDQTAGSIPAPGRNPTPGEPEGFRLDF